MAYKELERQTPEPTMPKQSPPRRIWPVKRPSKSLLPFHLLSEQGTWFYLFHALLTLLVLYPYLETHAENQKPWLMTLLNSAVVMTIVYALSFNRRQLALICFLAAPTLILYWVPASSTTVLLGCILTTLLYGYAILLTIPFLLHAEEVSIEEIYGASALYLLLGLAWANLFQVIEIIFPGSFYVASTHNLDQTLNWSDFLFFSFTTITTLGYGDITPITSQARSLAIIEAFTGVIYLTVMVSRAIGLHISQSIERRKNGQEK